jgi:hypothetical protein
MPDKDNDRGKADGGNTTNAATIAANPTNSANPTIAANPSNQNSNNSVNEPSSRPALEAEPKEAPAKKVQVKIRTPNRSLGGTAQNAPPRDPGSGSASATNSAPPSNAPSAPVSRSDSPRRPSDTDADDMHMHTTPTAAGQHSGTGYTGHSGPVTGQPAVSNPSTMRGGGGSGSDADDRRTSTEPESPLSITIPTGANAGAGAGAGTGAGSPGGASGTRKDRLGSLIASINSNRTAAASGASGLSASAKSPEAADPSAIISPTREETQAMANEFQARLEESRRGVPAPAQRLQARDGEANMEKKGVVLDDFQITPLKVTVTPSYRDNMIP